MCIYKRYSRYWSTYYSYAILIVFSAAKITLQNANEFNIKSTSPTVFFAYQGHENNPIEKYYFFRGRHQDYDYADIFAKNLILSGNIFPQTNSQIVQLFSGQDFTKGGHLALVGNDYSESEKAGCFMLCSTTADNNVHRLIGDKNGSLTWDNCHIEYLTNKLIDSTGFICYGSKLKIQWGTISTNMNTFTQVTLPISFTNWNSYSPIAIAAPLSTATASKNFTLCLKADGGYANNYFTIRNDNDMSFNSNWLTIGY